MKIELYDRVRLKSGESAHIVEVYEQGIAYEADIALEDSEYTTETIKHGDILYVYANQEERQTAV